MTDRGIYDVAVGPLYILTWIHLQDLQEHYFTKKQNKMYQNEPDYTEMIL